MLRISRRIGIAMIVLMIAAAGCNKKEADANALAEVKEQVDLTFYQNDIKVVRTYLEKKEGYYYGGYSVTPEGSRYDVVVKPENKIRSRTPRKWLIDIKLNGEVMPDREPMERKFKQLIEKDYKSAIKAFQLTLESAAQKFTGNAELANGAKMRLMAGWVDQLDFNGNKTGKKEFVFDTKPDGQNDIRRFAEISFDELLDR